MSRGRGETGGRGGRDPLRRAAARRPDALAVGAPDVNWSYRRLDREAEAVARRVRAELGPVRDGPERAASPPSRPRVAAVLPRRPDALAAIHGVPRGGAVLAPLHPDWTDAETSAYLSRLDPDLLLGPPGARERASRLVPELPRVPLGPPEGGAEAPAPPEGEGPAGPVAPGRGPAPEGDHSLVATSGSTGVPRPVRLTWRNHLSSARAAARRLGLGPDDRWLASLSPAHVGGLALIVRAAVLGSAVVLRRGSDADEAARLIDRGRVTHASLVPVMLRRLLDARGRRPGPDGLECLLVGGAATPGELLEGALDAGLPVALTYGLTEACSQVATAPPPLVRRKPGTVGPPLPGVELRVGDGGEISVRGPTVSPGYLDGEPAVSDGWLRTGDVGRMDEDGHLRVTGRLSDRIVTGGTTVHPAEVERALRSHPGVDEAAAVGVPSREWGEVVGAAVVTSASGPGRDELEAHCRRRLSAPRRPRRWLFLDRIPRGASGKTDRRVLRERLREGGTGR